MIHHYRIYPDFGFPKGLRNMTILLRFRGDGTPPSFRFRSNPKTEANGMINQYRIPSGFGRLLLRNGKRISQDKSLRFCHLSSFRLRNSDRFMKHLTIFLRFRSDGTTETDFRTC